MECSNAGWLMVSQNYDDTNLVDMQLNIIVEKVKKKGINLRKSLS